MQNNSSIEQLNWRGRWTFAAVLGGLAFGYGNFWRFGYNASEYGGLAYVLCYFGFVLVLAWPLAIAETTIGRSGRASPITGVKRLAREAKVSRLWFLLGPAAILCSLIVLAYGSVVAGWAVEYGLVMWRGSLQNASLDMAVDHFVLQLGDYRQMAYWHSWIMASVVLVAALPIHRGFGQIMRVLLPVMLLLLLAGNIAAYNLGDYESAMLRLFEMRSLELTRDGVMQALSQALYTLGIGMGVWMVYGSYAPNDRSISWNSAWAVVIDGVTSVFAALLIYGYIETQSIDPSGGIALMFVSLPYAMGQMPFSDIVGSLFYVLVVLASVTTCIALMEPATRHLSHRWRVPRAISALVVGLVAWGLGILCIYSLDSSRNLSYGDRSAFVWLDLLSANMLLPLCLMMIAAFVSWRLERQQLLSAFKSNGRGLFWLWSGVLRYIAPAAAFLVLIFGIMQRL